MSREMVKLKPYAVIFDIDGTIANIDHRLHHIKNGNKNYEAFYDECHYDKVIENVKFIYDQLLFSMESINNFVYDHMVHDCDEDENHREMHMLLVSGRPDTHRFITMEWLKRNNFSYHMLYMRKKGDYRPDYIIKEEILNTEIKPHYEVFLSFDDRQQVVDMWRRNGITCCQVAAWEEEQFIDHDNKYGELTMLIGPTGAGKTTYAVAEYDDLKEGEHLEIINSDNIRSELGITTYTREDNARVFRLAHELCLTYINNGINVIFDATNLHAKDRKALTSKLVENVNINYILLDKPLSEKIKYTRHNEELVRRHHESFQSGVKYALAGDEDSRVTVWDLRNS